MKSNLSGKHITAIVVCAGLSKRFGKNKIFYLLCKKPIIVWTLQSLESIKEISEIIIVLNTKDIKLFHKTASKYNFSKIKHITQGGKERQDSVFNGLKLSSKNTSVILVHDGARPLVSPSSIKKLITNIKTFDGAILATKVKDTIKESFDNTIINKTLNRDNLWAAQTPQVFKYNKLMSAMLKAFKENYYATDDAALIERYGGKIKILENHYNNVKITTIEDIVIAEALIKTGSLWKSVGKIL